MNHVEEKSLILKAIGEKEGRTKLDADKIDILVNRRGFGQRKYRHLSEDFNLETPLEVALRNDDFKSFELLFNYLLKNQSCNRHFIYIVMMRNLRQVMNKPELMKTMKNFYVDDAE